MFNSFVLHMEKYGFSAIKGLEVHDRRARKLSNPDIKLYDTKKNYDLSNNTNSWVDTVNEKIKDCKTQKNKAIRKDAVALCSVVVSASPSFFATIPKDMQEMYFKDCYSFLNYFFGEDNIVGATVHLDEKTPHMHYNFVPKTKDKRLCAKEVVNREQLEKLQSEFQTFVGMKYNLLRDKGSKAFHISKEEYERQLENTEKKYAHYHFVVNKTLEDMPKEYKALWEDRFTYYDNPTKYLEEKKQSEQKRQQQRQQEQEHIKTPIKDDDDYGNW